MTAAPPKTIKVVLVDDHTLVRESLANALGNFPDIEVVGHASNGVDALERARELHPDIMVMDVSMPRMSGLYATQRLSIELPHVRILGLSMHTSQDMARAMRSAGAAGYLTKETPISVLVDTLRYIAAPHEEPGAS